VLYYLVLLPCLDLPPLKSDGTLHSEPTEKADILNGQFQKAFSEKTSISNEEFQKQDDRKV
jgi:hypothetical protein